MLSLCIITKNEEKTLPILFKSIVDYVDQIVVADTGSTDNTKKVCEEWCKDKLKWTEFTWCDDFSAARQFSFEQADGDWLIWADADDEIAGGKRLKEIIEQCEENNVNAVTFPYHYLFDVYGNTKALQIRERLVRNDGSYKWMGKLHEALVPVVANARAFRLEDVVWYHRTTEDRASESIKRNVAILEKAAEEEIKEEKVDPRTIFNLGNAYVSNEQYEKAIACYMRYIPLSGWDEEIYLARVRIALCLFYLKQYDASAEHALLAIGMKPQYPDGYTALGKIYFEKKKYEDALHLFSLAAMMRPPENLPVYNPLDYTANMHWLLGHCHLQLSRFEVAKKQFLEYQKYIKSDDVVEILSVIDDALEEKANVKAIKQLGKLLGDKLWKIIPKRYYDYPEVYVEKNQVVRKKLTGGKDMAIYCGKSPTEWDPSSEKQEGIGGSEEAVINVARLLAKEGWNITVFGRPKKEGVYEGVTYTHYSDYNPRDAYDVLISWRIPALFNADVNAKRKYVWLHDTTPPEQVYKALHRFDKLIVLSKYHRSLYPEVPESKIIYSGNGLNPEHFKEKVKKNPYYCINTSAPTRGLEVLLDMWPKIRKQVPDAELHWFYGWEVYGAMLEHAGVKLEDDDLYKRIKKKFKQPGVFEEGRVDHEEIAKKYQEAQLWVYPTEFPEVYCITADKAQAGGALPVTTNVAALDERVKYGTLFPVSDIYTNKTAQQQFIDQVVHYLQNQEEVDLEREGMVVDRLKECAWERIAKQWNKEL